MLAPSPELIAATRALLASNTRTATHNGNKFTYTVPSADHYPFQWTGWDSQIIVNVFVRLAEIARTAGDAPQADQDLRRSKEEIRGIFSCQILNEKSPEYGFIPHVRFWDKTAMSQSPLSWQYLESKGFWTFLPWAHKPETSALMQPPLLAQAVERIWHATGDIAFLQESLPVLKRYYQYFERERDPDNDGLISIIAQFESGIDYGPAYDSLNIFSKSSPRPWRLILRARWPQVLNKFWWRYDTRKILGHSPWQQEDILVNSIWIQGLQALARLADVSRETHLAHWAFQTADRALQSLVAQCWDDKTGFFWNRVGGGAGHWPKQRVKTIIGLMPLILPDLPPRIAERLLAHLRNPKEFWTPYPIPSVAIDETAYTEDNRVNGKRFIWRGPSFPFTNYLLYQGLTRRHGSEKEAAHIASQWLAAWRDNGKTFVEFRNPKTGVPTSDAKNFTGETLLLDI